MMEKYGDEVSHVFYSLGKRARELIFSFVFQNVQYEKDFFKN